MDIEMAWLKDRYLQELNERYQGEMESLDHLPHMAEVAQTPMLRTAFEAHVAATRAQIGRLDAIFAGLGSGPIQSLPPQSPTGAQKAGPASSARASCLHCEAGVVSAAHQMERHEIRGYLMALNCAEILRDQPAIDLLEQTLVEEYQVEQILSELSLPDPCRLRCGQRLC